jgi:hypothetical protein
MAWPLILVVPGVAIAPFALAHILKPDEPERHAFAYGGIDFLMANILWQKITWSYGGYRISYGDNQTPMANIASPMANIRSRMANIETPMAISIPVWRKCSEIDHLWRKPS